MAYTSKFSESLPVVDLTKLESREKVEAIPTKTRRLLAKLQVQKDVVCNKSCQLHKKTIARLKTAKENLEAGLKVSETQRGMDKLSQPDARHSHMFKSSSISICCMCQGRFPPREVVTLGRSEIRTCSHTWCIRCFNGSYLERALKHSFHWPPRCCKHNVVPHEFIRQNRDVLHPVLYERAVCRAVPVEDRVYCCYCGRFLLASHPDEMPMPGHSNLLSCDECRMSKKSFLTCRTCRKPAHANSGEGCRPVRKVFEHQLDAHSRHWIRRVKRQDSMLHGIRHEIRCRLHAMRCRSHSSCRS